ncbi:MAG: hypothetical protein EON97_00540 [Chitinophagaceae bacterium]|nr:MAG: hypothetical protein EON97_00540 [Chitinophagaceae bacterium]
MAFLRTGKPLTIACHIKSYLLAELSAFVAEVSVEGIVAVSGTAGAVVFVSRVDVADVSAVVESSEALSLHATKAPIANTKRSFFIVPVFVFLMIIWC